MTPEEREKYNVWINAPNEVLEYAKTHLFTELERIQGLESKYRNEINIISRILGERANSKN